MRAGIAAILTVILCQPWLALASEWPEQRHVQVAGHGEVEAVPDMAHIAVRISKIGRESSAIKREVDVISDAVLTAAREHGLDKAAIRAAQIRVSPEYNWQEGKRELRGYRVERQIHLSLKSLGRYSALIDALVAAGATHIDRVQFDLSERDRLQLQAMEKALQNARAKAEVLAKGLGRKLDGPYRVVENSGGGHPAPMMAVRADRAEAAPAMPLGMQTLRADLTVIYWLK